MNGMLYLVGTPIGNLEDMTFRAVRILSEVDLIAAEDTRRTMKLLNKYDIKTRTTSYHEHNKRTKGDKLIELITSGKNIALVSDAGMPAISDPGEDLVRQAINSSITVSVIPGSTAGVSALALSGLSTKRFVFEGFLPREKRDRLRIYENLQRETRTIIIYEAPHRLRDTLAELYDRLGDRHCSVSCELTKMFEQNIQGSLKSLSEYYMANTPKGEFVIVVDGVSEQSLIEQGHDQWSKMPIDEHVQIYISGGMSEKEAMKKAAADRGIGKREIYAEYKINKP